MYVRTNGAPVNKRRETKVARVTESREMKAIQVIFPSKIFPSISNYGSKPSLKVGLMKPQRKSEQKRNIQDMDPKLRQECTVQRKKLHKAQM